MAKRSSMMRTGLCEARAVEGARVQMKRCPTILRWVIAVFGSLTVCMSGIVVVARMRGAPQIIEPPQNLLPGSHVPTNISCDTVSDRRFRCRISREGEDIYPVIDDKSQIIVHTTISARQQTIGNLLAAWGTPTGFTRFGPAIYIYWDTRYAYLFKCSFEPVTRVRFIGYGLTHNGLAWQRQLPWRGFTRDKHYDCSEGWHNP